MTTAGYSPSLGKNLLMGYLPNELAVPGTKLQSMYMNELYPAPSWQWLGLRSRRHPSEGLIGAIMKILCCVKRVPAPGARST